MSKKSRKPILEPVQNVDTAAWAAAIAKKKRFSEEVLACRHAAMKESNRQRIDRLKSLSELTRNPLYVWEAIAYSFLFGDELPAWCLAYIAETSWEMLGLMQKVLGPDFSISIEAVEGHERLQKKTAKEAAAGVSRALQITRPGYNAFKDIQSDTRKVEDASLVDAAIHFQEWRTRIICEGLPDGMVEAVPQVEEHFTSRFGPLAAAETAVEAALAKIEQRRNLGKTRTGEGSNRQVRERIKEGRTLLKPNKMREPNV